MMTLALLRKELRELRPYLWLMLVFVLLEIGDSLLHYVDRHTLAAGFDQKEVGIILMLIGFAIGTGISNREREEGTLAFIDGLPASRAHLFAAKIMAAWIVLFAYPLFNRVAMIVMHVMSRGTLDHQIHFGVLLTGSLMTGLLLLVALLFGAAFGLFRSLSWAMAGLAVTVMSVLTDRVPWAAVLNPITLVEPRVFGTKWHLDWELIIAQLALAVLFGAAALAGFFKAGLPPRSRVSRRPVVSFVVGSFTVVSVFIAFAIFMERDSAYDEGVPAGEIVFARSPPAHAATGYFRFSYPAHRSREALALAEQADAVFEEVHRLLGEPPGDPVEVDLSGSREHTAGTAFHGRIRMRIGGDDLSILAHETAHVSARRLAGGERAHLWSRATVLDEGIATWVDQRWAPPERREERRLILAAYLHRRQLSIESMADYSSFSREWDENLKYPAGEAMIEAMVDLYGGESVARLVRAFGDESLPQDLAGLPLWIAAFQIAGMDLPRVFDAAYRALEADRMRFEGEIESLPRPVPVLVTERGSIGVILETDGEVPDGWHARVRFRPDPQASPGDSAALGSDEVYWRHRSDIRGGQVCLQAGLSRETFTLYEEWTCIRTGEALPFEDAIR